MVNINKSNCCLFKDNPNIDPITKKSLNSEEKKEWMNKCTKFMSSIEDEKIENLKNVEIFSPRQSEIINLSVPVQRPPSPSVISKRAQKPPLPGQKTLPIQVSPSLPSTSQVGKSQIIYPSERIISTPLQDLDNYYISKNSNLIFDDDILNNLRIVDLKYILKNYFTNVNDKNIIKEYNKIFSNTDTYTEILKSKQKIIQFIKFLKNDNYKNIIFENLNDEIYKIFIDNKLTVNEKIKQLFSYNKRPVSTVEKIIDFKKLKGKKLYDQFTEYNINNNIDLLNYRATIINSDNFFNEINIENINNDEYSIKYTKPNYVFVLKLFYVNVSDILKPDDMPDNVYDLIYINKKEDIQFYKQQIDQILKENNNNLDNSVFIKILKIFLNYIRTKPYNKYIPPNLNKYILLQKVIKPVQILPTKQKRAISTELVRPIISEQQPSASRSKSAKQIRPKLPTVVAQPLPPRPPSSRFFYERSKTPTGKSISLTYPKYKETSPQEIEEIYTPVSPPKILSQQSISPKKKVSPPVLYPIPQESSPPYKPSSPPPEYYEMKRKQEEEEERKKLSGSISPEYQPTNITEEESLYVEKIRPNIEYQRRIGEFLKKK